MAWSAGSSRSIRSSNRRSARVAAERGQDQRQAQTLTAQLPGKRARGGERGDRGLGKTAPAGGPASPAHCCADGTAPGASRRAHRRSAVAATVLDQPDRGAQAHIEPGAPFGCVEDLPLGLAPPQQFDQRFGGVDASCMARARARGSGRRGPGPRAGSRSAATVGPQMRQREVDQPHRGPSPALSPSSAMTGSGEMRQRICKLRPR
jgi:hypothetical protein